MMLLICPMDHVQKLARDHHDDEELHVKYRLIVRLRAVAATA